MSTGSTKCYKFTSAINQFENLIPGKSNAESHYYNRKHLYLKNYYALKILAINGYRNFQRFGERKKKRKDGSGGRCINKDLREKNLNF